MKVYAARLEGERRTGGWKVFMKKMEPHRQACDTSCYVQTGDILSKEHSPTAKAVVLCVEG
jgi:hypothetical protein